MPDIGQESAQDFEFDLHISLRPVILALLLSSIVLFFVADAESDLSNRQALQLIVLVLQVISIMAWLLEGWKPCVGRWFTIIALSVLIHLGGQWLAMPASLALVGIPTVLAAALSGLPGGAIAASGETLLVLLLSGSAVAIPGQQVQAVTLIAIWATLGIVWAIDSPMHQLGRWVWEYYQRAQIALEDARNRRAELAQALDDSAYANRQLALTNERLAALSLIAEEAQRTKAAFVAKVSHEFRTPLNMIIGLIDLLVETPEVYGQDLPLALFEDLEIVHRSCEHLSDLVNDVLNLSQAEAGRLTLHREEADLAEIMDDALTVVRPLLDKKSLSLQITVPDDLPQISCDRTRVRQVILNLLSNAARFTDEGGVTIVVDKQGPYVVISVADTGPGISPQDAERIFEPFCQGTNQPWRARQGSGLGLSISKQFVELHGGHIWLDSEPGIGTKLSFSLPIDEPVPHIARPGHWIKEDWVWTERRSRIRFPHSHYRPRMVVCDSTGGLGSMHDWDGVEITQVASLAQAFQELCQCPAHALVLNAASFEDLWPLVDRARLEIPDTPIVGCCIPSWQEYALGAGILDYLVKPVKRADLERVLAQADKPVERILIVDDDLDVVRLWMRMLRACDNSLELVTASNGMEALDKARRYSPSLVLLDILMPGMDGRQVLEAMNQDETISDIPVVLISAQDPVERPLVSQALLVAMGERLSPSWVLDCALDLSTLLLWPDREHARVPARTDDAVPVLAGRG